MHMYFVYLVIELLVCQLNVVTQIIIITRLTYLVEDRVIQTVHLVVHLSSVVFPTSQYLYHTSH